MNQGTSEEAAFSEGVYRIKNMSERQTLVKSPNPKLCLAKLGLFDYPVGVTYQESIELANHNNVWKGTSKFVKAFVLDDTAKEPSISTAYETREAKKTRAFKKEQKMAATPASENEQKMPAVVSPLKIPKLEKTAQKTKEQVFDLEQVEMTSRDGSTMRKTVTSVCKLDRTFIKVSKAVSSGSALHTAMTVAHETLRMDDFAPSTGLVDALRKLQYVATESGFYQVEGTVHSVGLMRDTWKKLVEAYGRSDHRAFADYLRQWCTLLTRPEKMKHNNTAEESKRNDCKPLVQQVVYMESAGL